MNEQLNIIIPYFFRDYRASKMSSQCPGNRLEWDLTAEDIKRRSEELIAKYKAVYDAIANLAPDQANYDNVIKVLSTRHQFHIF